MIPPITTVASGRCTSAPVVVARAMGIRPSEPTRAVMSTGRSLVSAPSRMASSSGIYGLHPVCKEKNTDGRKE